MLGPPGPISPAGKPLPDAGWIPLHTGVCWSCLRECVSVLRRGGEYAFCFLHPELPFTCEINGLAFTSKATSVTHSAQEALEELVSCLWFSHKADKAMLNRRKENGSVTPGCTVGARVRAGAPPGWIVHAGHVKPPCPVLCWAILQLPAFRRLPFMPQLCMEDPSGAGLWCHFPQGLLASLKPVDISRL